MVDDELTELLVKLSTKLLAKLAMEVNGEMFCVVYIRGRKESAWKIYVCFLFGIHSGSEGECLNDIHLFLFGIHSGSEGEYSNDIRLFLFDIHSGSEGECSNDIRLFLFDIHSGLEGECSNDICMLCMIYIRGQKRSARMVYSREYD